MGAERKHAYVGMRSDVPEGERRPGLKGRVHSILGFAVLGLLVATAACTSQRDLTRITAGPTVSPNAWLSRIDQAEARWNRSGITSYRIAGWVSWGWHKHSFEVIIQGSQVSSWDCRLGYDTFTGDSWCLSDFTPPDYTVPALYRHARGMVEFGTRYGAGAACFYFEFDPQTGVPRRMFLDCPEAHDEEEDWLLAFTSRLPS